ncbi:unnamed protein product [Lymnaea stagnalis]|uniref:NR LBD domain-containing protein n=1 Tax=Lymnaea stagnalis TaxID=6523 RepID=A0AAV2IHD0_LYMST
MDAILKRLFEADAALMTSTAHTPEHALYKKQLEYNNAYTHYKKFGHLACQKACQENKRSAVFLDESSARSPNCSSNLKPDHERRIWFRTHVPETFKTSQNPLDDLRHYSPMLRHGLGGKDHTDKSLRCKTELIGRSENRTPTTSAQHHDHLRAQRNMPMAQVTSGPSLGPRACSSDDRRTCSNSFCDQSLRSTLSRARRNSQTGDETNTCQKVSGTSKWFSEMSGTGHRAGNALNMSLLGVGEIKQAGYFRQRDVNSLRHYDVAHQVSNGEGSRRPASLRVDPTASVPESPGASLPESPGASLPESHRASAQDGARAPVQDSPIRKAGNGKPWLDTCDACKESKTAVIARAENWVMGYIGFAKAIPGFSSLAPQDQATLLRHAWDEVWILGAYRGYNCEIGVAVMPSGKCFHADEMEKGWGRGYARLAFDLASILKRNNLTSDLVTLLKAICIVSPDRCDLVNTREVEDMQWTLVACLLHHVEATHPSDRTAFPRLISILTSLRELSESAQSTMDSASVGAVFGCNIVSDIFAPF